jgi:hypothetical protein
MLQAFSAPANRTRTFYLLGLGIVFGLTAIVVGIADNLPGILLLFLAVIAFALGIVHPWETSKPFLYLLGISLLVIAVSVPLHNLFEGLANNVGRLTLTGRLFEVASGAFFFFALLLCPVLILIGTIGAILRWVERM